MFQENYQSRQVPLNIFKAQFCYHAYKFVMLQKFLLIGLYDRKNLVKLTDKLDQGHISWNKFVSKVKKLHFDRQGAPYPR